MGIDSSPAFLCALCSLSLASFALKGLISHYGPKLWSNREAPDTFLETPRYSSYNRLVINAWFGHGTTGRSLRRTHKRRTHPMVGSAGTFEPTSSYLMCVLSYIADSGRKGSSVR